MTYGQQINPNKLPMCPAEDSQKLMDTGNGGRTEKWHNCWARYEYKVSIHTVYEGEWQFGRPFGYGSVIAPQRPPFAGNVQELTWDGKVTGSGKVTFQDGGTYEGDMVLGNRQGFGLYSSSGGSRYRGFWKNDAPNGTGIYAWADGQREEGVFVNGTLKESKKVSLPGENLANLKENIENQPYQSLTTGIDRDRQQQALEFRKQAEEEKRQQQAEINNPNKNSAITDSRRRLALVIGNAAYKNSPLRNPTSDANLISSALSSSGFIVDRYHNLTYAKMREAVRTFGEKLSRGDVGLFYFSGHAVQYRGKNYLLPISEDLKYADEIPSTAMDIDFVLAKMETAKNDLNIVVLDACRNNPWGSEARNLERGLTTINAAKGTFIAFATSPGNVALDGAGSNSPYTKNLARAIRKGGMTLEQVFKEVRRNVISETNSQQVPWENSSILGDFYFK
jgi:hypothetical protein